MERHNSNKLGKFILTEQLNRMNMDKQFMLKNYWKLEKTWVLKQKILYPNNLNWELSKI